MSGPTNRAARLTPEDMPESAVVNRIGPEWLETAQKADAADTKFHPAFDPRDIPANVEVMVPGVPWQEPPKPPAPPSEQELRERLSEALTRKTETDTALIAATEALDRAVALRAERQQAVAGFRYLEDAIGSYTVEALRLNGRTDLPAEFRTEIAARDMAATDLQAAEQAVGILRGAQGEAQSAAAQQTRLANGAAVAVMSQQIVAIVEHHQEALRVVEETFRLMASFDRFATQYNAVPSAVMGALRAEPLDHRRYVAMPGLNVQQWRDSLAALMANPQAEIEIDA